jgi:hypothetical protein
MSRLHGFGEFGFVRVAGCAGLALVFAAAVADGQPTPVATDPPWAAYSARLSLLMDSPDHPLPMLSVVVPEVSTPEQVDQIVNQSKEPFLFMLYQAKGPQAAPQVPELFFFQLMALEYLGNAGARPDPIRPVHFRTIAVDNTPAAASELFATAAVQPVYILFDPRESGSARFRVIEQAKAPDGSSFSQRVVEGWISMSLGVPPAVIAPFPITAANQHQAIFVDPNPTLAPTATWIVTLYSPPDPKWQASVNRLRVLLSVERYFYDGRIRFGEVNLGADSGVFQTLIGDANHLPVPTEPQVWLTDPVGHISVQYKPENGRPATAELTQGAFQDWLNDNHVPPPGNVALNAEMVSQQLYASKIQPGR